MKEKRVVFMGTPTFAVPVLEKLIENTNVILVVSQPDKEVGRKKIKQMTPVKEIAVKHNIPVFQPEKIRKDYEPIMASKPDLIISCAYGQIIPEVLLNLPKLGAFNVHASLLPKYRGGAPIHWALINGEKQTGVTIMYMDKGMDTGDMISKVIYDIKPEDNVGTLHEVLSSLGANLLIETLPSIINHTNEREKQDEEKASYAYNIKREDERLDLNKSGEEVINKIRGLNPFPTANILVNGEEFKILEASFVPHSNTTPGKVREVTKNSIGIDVLDGTIYATHLKPFGKKAMNTKDYLNGVQKETILNWQINA